MVTTERRHTTLGSASAPGKVILMGEHAVVYGMSAIAVPVHDVAVTASVLPWDGSMVIVSGPGSADAGANTGRDTGTPDLLVDVAGAPEDDPWATAVRGALNAADYDGADLPPWRIEVTSTIPVGAGMGSSAALAVALARAVANAAGVELDDHTISAVAYEAERRTHGTPSGIDNAVVTFGRPIRFSSGLAEPLPLVQPAHLVVADSGDGAPTLEMVAGVRARHDARPTTYGRWFRRIDDMVREGSRALASGEFSTLGRLMNANHLILQGMRVSSPTLDHYVAVARSHGALGAKLSGGGGGGVMVALVTPSTAAPVAQALREAGSRRVYHVCLEPGLPVETKGTGHSEPTG